MIAAGMRFAWPRVNRELWDVNVRIDAGSYFYQSGQTASRTVASPTSLAIAPGNTPVESADSPSSGIIKTDFTGMTRQQMFGWMNNQIRSGAMSLDDSTSFLGMVLKVDAATGQPVGMASDSTLVNFIDRATQGIAGALSRGDQDGAARLQAALAAMQRHQGQMTGVDISA